MKFPGIQDRIHALECNKEHVLTLNQESGLTCKVVLMDANHILGSVMILFSGYFGTILHTGDMRWSRKLLKTNHLLFNQDSSLKMAVDELIMDNTYCDPIFDFPTQVYPKPS